MARKNQKKGVSSEQKSEHDKKSKPSSTKYKTNEPKKGPSTSRSGSSHVTDQRDSDKEKKHRSPSGSKSSGSKRSRNNSIEDACRNDSRASRSRHNSKDRDPPQQKPSTAFNPEAREFTSRSGFSQQTQNRGNNWRNDNNGRSSTSAFNNNSRGSSRSQFKNANRSDPQNENGEFWSYERARDSFDNKFVRVQEETIDLFSISKDHSLAHCVAEDMGMGSGIAVQFRQKFRNVAKLLNQRQSPGGLAVLPYKDDTFIYYLVTKMFSQDKPTYRNLFKSLQQLRTHMTENGVKKLALPRIGCGLDRLEWSAVKFMLEFIFRNSNVDILVCNFEPAPEGPSPQKPSKPPSRQVNVTHPIETIDNGTIIIYLSSIDGFVSKEMLALDEKFHFLKDFQQAPKTLGNVVQFKSNLQYVLFGCIVRTRNTDPIDYEHLQQCVSTIQKANSDIGSGYVGFQAINDQNPATNAKVCNILRNTIAYVEVHVCWTGEMENQNPENKRTSYGSSSNYGGRPSFGSPKPDNENKQAPYGNPPNNRGRCSLETPKAVNPDYKNRSSYGNASNLNGRPTRSDPKPEQKTNVSEIRYGPNPALKPFGNNPNDHWGPNQEPSWNSNSSGVDRSGGPTWNDASDSTPVDSSAETAEHWDASFNSSETSAYGGGEGSFPNHEYEIFQHMEEKEEMEITVLREILEDSLQGDSVRAYFVTESMDLVTPIRVGNDFKNLGQLYNQRQKLGCIIEVFAPIFYMIVKDSPSDEVESNVLFTCLQRLRYQVKQKRILKFKIPQIFYRDDNEAICDGKYMLQYIFKDTNVDITICKVTDEKTAQIDGLRPAKHLTYPISNIRKNSIVLYLSTEDGVVTKDMKLINAKFDIMSTFNLAKRKLGEVVRHKVDGAFAVFGCIVKQSEQAAFDFDAFQQCVYKAVCSKVVENLTNIGVHAVPDESEEQINLKITKILLTATPLDVIVCWHGLEELKPSKPL